MSERDQQDPRIKETLKHLKKLAGRRSKPLSVQEYLEYRHTHAPHLPSLTTIYRLFRSWSRALELAGVEHGEKSALSRTEDTVLIAALQECAKDLDIKVLSSHLYDDWREKNKKKWEKAGEEIRPSSSVIRKWLGRWAIAVEKAGLQTSERAVPRRPSVAEIIEALRTAKENVDGLLTQQAYSRFYAELDEEERKRWPDVLQILNQFPNWEAALRQADVQQADVLHPEALWTSEEARRIYEIVVKLKGEFSEESYAEVVAVAKKPLPAYDIVAELLRM